MASAGEVSALSFADLDRRIQHAVADVSAAGDTGADPFRGMCVTNEQAAELAIPGPPPGIDARLDDLGLQLGLSGLERAVLAACAAPEVSWRYARLYGYLHDDLTRQLASPRLIAALLAGADLHGEAVLGCLDAHAPLRRLGAVRVLEDPGLPLADRLIKCADRLAAWLIGGLEPALLEIGELVPVPAIAPVSAAVAADLAELLAAKPELPVTVIGADAAAAVASITGRPVLLAAASSLRDRDAVSEARLIAVLGQATLVTGPVHELQLDERRALIRRLASDESTPLFCADPAQPDAVRQAGHSIDFVLPELTPDERERAWAAHVPGADIDAVSAKFRLTAGQIARAAETAQTLARIAGRGIAAAVDLDAGARSASSHGLAGLATQIRSDVGWDDLIAPARAHRALRMIASFLRHRDRVLMDWEFARAAGPSRGLTVLFAGESGTGKTMAAQVVAHDLGLELFRIDLAGVVSKFIGETEKQLDRIFTAASGSNAILLFDEADALFGKRSEVQDAHDRYANVEVAYLLQRIEQYDGAVILTTNLRRNIDQAFLRRLDLVIEFPFPEESDRARLWERLLPTAAPKEGLDIGFLARRFKLSGGSIRNASLAAATLAADDDEAITMEAIARGIALEYDKLGRLTLEADFEHLYEAIRS
jgi:AAA+ superfamily predicted ATPase